MMKKRLLAFLAAVLLAAAGSAGAEYKSYRATEGNWWKCFPLDAHNAVVVSWLWEEDSRPDPWYVCWYRDGELYRKLTGTVEESPAGRMRTPYPALWDGERLSLYYCVPKEEKNTCRQDGQVQATVPDNFQVYLADWTDNGLENERVLTEAWFDTYDKSDRGIVVFSGEDGRTALYNGRASVLPDSVPVNQRQNVLRVLPVDDEGCLLKVMDRENYSAGLVCTDRGTERYRVTLPREEAGPDRPLMADRQGGFFFMNGYRGSGYEPESLTHYDGNGQYDRTVTLSGDKVVVHISVSTAGGDSGFCTLYGTAVANSRKVYTVFAMTLDEDLNVVSLDVRKIDPAYGDYGPLILTASDGTPYVWIENLSEKRLFPVLIPFEKLQKSSKTYGLRLSQ